MDGEKKEEIMGRQNWGEGKGDKGNAVADKERMRG